MARSLLLWGMLIGLCGGLLAAGFAELAGEGAIGQALAFEEGRSEAPGEAHEQAPGGAHPDGPGAAHEHGELVSRGTQRYLGLPVAAALYGAALGGLLALAFALAYGRIGRAGPAATALAMAAAGFVVVFLVPFLKYPANPPAVGDPGTIGSRTGLYLLMIGISLAAALAAVRVWQRLSARGSAATAALGGIGLFLALAIGAGLFLPAVNEVPSDFPATALWQFRLAAVGTQLVLWATLGLGLAAASRRVLERRAPRALPGLAGSAQR